MPTICPNETPSYIERALTEGRVPGSLHLREWVRVVSAGGCREAEREEHRRHWAPGVMNLLSHRVQQNQSFEQVSFLRKNPVQVVNVTYLVYIWQVFDIYLYLCIPWGVWRNFNYPQWAVHPLNKCTQIKDKYKKIQANTKQYGKKNLTMMLIIAKILMTFAPR